MTFDPNMAYYVQLYTRNGAGLERITTSTSVYFDTSPPISEGVVMVLPNFETVSYLQGNLTNQMVNRSSAVCLLDTDVVAVLFDLPSDLESGIFRCVMHVESFAYCKQSKTGWWEGPGTGLAPLLISWIRQPTLCIVLYVWKLLREKTFANW